MQFDAPVMAPFETVLPDWIDHNGHLNMAYYNVLFDHAVDHLFEQVGCGPDYVKSRNLSIFTVEVHLRYLKELKAGDRVHASVQLLDHDGRKMRLFQELFHEDGWLAATSEGVFLHVDLSGPRAAPFPADIAERLAALSRAHAELTTPDAAGSGITLSRTRPAV